MHFMFTAKATRQIREWGTPLTIGSFIIMAATGSLMFFHRAMALNGLLHRWSGLAMIGAVVLHALANWSSIERYIKKSNLARALIGLGAFMLVASFVNWWGYPGKSEGNVYRAVMNAPSGHVAALNGMPFTELQTRLRGVGIAVSSPDETLNDATHGDLDLQDTVVEVLFLPSPA